MPELRVLIGLPGSGKTTYARTHLCCHQNWRRINWDEEREARGLTTRFDRKEEDRMQSDLFGQAEYWGSHGWNVVVDNTNLSKRTRNKWRAVAVRAGMEYIEHRMEASLQTCVALDASREGRAQVGRAVIERLALFAGLVPFPAHEEYVIVDMDGTIADCSERRKFISDGRHDWENFEAHCLNDEPIAPIIKLVDMLRYNRGYRILIVSGRQVGRAGKDTVAWLDRYKIPYDHVFMRRGGDNRPDHVVKQEILDRLPKERIAYVLDDRNQVVEMWRRNGLTCLQVAPGNF